MNPQNVHGEAPRVVAESNPLSSSLTEILQRRHRRLGALVDLGQKSTGEDPGYGLFFKQKAPPVFAYYACLDILNFPDVIDDQSGEIDFLFNRVEGHGQVLAVTGLLAFGSSMGRIAKRETVAHVRENFGAFAAWAISRDIHSKAEARPVFPLYDEAYAIGHTGYRLFAASKRPAFDKWVDAICVKPSRQVLVEPDVALASFIQARGLFQTWEGLNAAHQA